VDSTGRWVTIILLVGEASGVFAGFCPSWFTVSSPFFHEQEAKDGNVKRIRWGEAAATAIVLATGAAVSVSERDPIPFIAASVICGVFVGGYEYMIAHPSSDDEGSQPFPWQRVSKAA
jgi:hypothetical protein